MFLEMKHIVKRFEAVVALNDVNLSVSAGEIHGLLGENGAGKSTLMNILAGAIPATSGEILLDGKKIEDMSIMDNLSMAHFVTKHKKFFIKKADELAVFARNQKATAIKVGSPEDYITSLSGGNQQKVIISRWLEIDSQVYILDNPTQGIDVGAKFEIYKIINELGRSGKSLIVFSSEFPEIYKIADRCLVLYKGSINAQLDRENLTDMNVMYYATGGNLDTHSTAQS